MATFDFPTAPNNTLPAGTGTQTGHPPITILTSVASSGSSTGGAVDVVTFSLPANTLSSDGMGLNITAFGLKAANANSATLTVTIGGTTVGTIGGTTSGAMLSCLVTVIRTSSSTLSFRTTNTLGSTSAVNAGKVTGLDFTGAITIKQTFPTATANNDITGAGFRVEWFSN